MNEYKVKTDESIVNTIPIVDIKDYTRTEQNLLVVSLNDLSARGSEFLFKPHRLNYYQILLIEEGNGVYCVDAHEFECSNGLFTTSKGQIESFKEFNNLKGYALLFSEEFIYKNSKDMEWLNSLLIFDPTIASACVNIDEREAYELRFNLQRVFFELGKKDDDVQSEILLLAVKIFLLVAEKIKQLRMPRTPLKISTLDYLYKFKESLEENYCSCRSVNYYARQLCITPKKLNQVTNTYWGKSAKRIIEDRVLLEIKRLLLYTDHTTKEIGISMGFNDPTNFNKFFKKNFKTSPLDYRLSNKNLYSNYKMEVNDHNRPSVSADNNYR